LVESQLTSDDSRLAAKAKPHWLTGGGQLPAPVAQLAQ
jgi:hypothetical protein